MDNNADMAVRTRMMTEFADEKRHLKTVKSEVQRLGEQLIAIGRSFCDHPGDVTIDPESLPFLNVERLQTVIEDCRLRQKKVSGLRAELISMGILENPAHPSLRRV
jgi:hypothetical protein